MVLAMTGALLSWLTWSRQSFPPIWPRLSGVLLSAAQLSGPRPETWPGLAVLVDNQDQNQCLHLNLLVEIQDVLS